MGRMIVVTFLWAGLAIAGTVLAGLLGYEAQATGWIRLAFLVFFLLITATWLVLTVEQTQAEFGTNQTAQALTAGVIAMLPTLAVAALLTWGAVAFSLTVLEQPLTTPITDYASCVAGGGAVVETEPRHCITPTNTYVKGRE